MACKRSFRNRRGGAEKHRGTERRDYTGMPEALPRQHACIRAWLQWQAFLKPSVGWIAPTRKTDCVTSRFRQFHLAQKGLEARITGQLPEQRLANDFVQ
jgi:hypothetical protein